ncbi:unnamed protein product [Adineta steineri]|uniref:Uncharacterized protein n=1 Tax=Adineta steineri TaxID=433720 RepID=A0A820K511_9BILA|nr:unnamed protein product [Adineta steineri]
MQLFFSFQIKMDIDHSVIHMYEQLMNNNSNETSLQSTSNTSVEQSLNNSTLCNNDHNKVDFNTNTSENNNTPNNQLSQCNENHESTEDNIEILNIQTSM